jgi:hypothetical protein
MPGDGPALVWSYVDGTDVGSAGKRSGTLQYDKVLKPGPYKAYFLENNGYNILATTSFVITDDESDMEPELPEGVYFEENFDEVNLGPFESDSESNGDGTDWASEGPEGWVMRKNNGHGLTGGGSDVVEFNGWTFLDPVSWNATAGQNRLNFTKGTGVIAVADSDEYDDKDDARLNATLSTPSIDISDASGSKLILKYDSSWRKEPQIGSVSVSYDGGEQIELLKLDGNSPDAYNETVELELNNPSGAKSAVISWNYEGHNNWWWAIDNISVYEKVVENTAPVVTGQSLSVNEDEAVSITLQGSDEDKDDLTFTVLNQPKNGALSGTGANLTYTPKANYYGSESFTFKANDGVADSNTATISIKVDSVNDKPVVTGQSLSVNEDETLSIILQGSDEDKDDLTFTVLNQPKNGALSGTGANLTYTPKANYIGSDSFTFKANDGVADSNIQTISIEIIKALDPALSFTKEKYNIGEAIIAEFDGAPGNIKDWIGIYREEDKPSLVRSLKWIYLDGTQLGQKAVKSGVVSFTDDFLPEGRYKGYLFENNSSANILATTSFEIIGLPVIDIKDKFYVDENIRLSYKKGPGNPKSWIGIWPANNDPLNSYSKKWSYVDGTQEGLIGKENGNLNFGKDLPPGDYLVCLINNDEKEKILAQKIFSISAKPTVIPPDKDKKKWTIMVYSQGDNNLAHYIMLQNKVFDAIGSNENVNIIIQTDYDTSRKDFMNSVSRYDNDIDNITSGVTRIIVDKKENGIDISKPNFISNASRDTVVEERFDESSKYKNRMDDPEFFGEFLDWGFSNFPAERYGLFFLDHGGSWQGFGGDEQDGLHGSNPIKPRAFRKEINRAFNKYKINKFDFVNFFACLMGSVEVLDAFDGLCDVLYANPEICYLWKYNHEARARFIGHLLNNPDIDNISLANYEVDNWMPKGVRPIQYETDIGVHSAYNMAEYSNFKNVFKSFSQTLIKEHKNYSSLILAARRNATPYWVSSADKIKKPTDYIDLAHFAELISKSAEGKLASDSINLLNSIDKLVINKFVGSMRPEVSSLGIHYPIKGFQEGWKYSYYKTYFLSKKTEEMKTWDVVPNYWELTGTGADWLKFLIEVNKASGSTSTKPIEYVLNSDGELVPSRNSEFGQASNNLIIASDSQPGMIEFEIKETNQAFDYTINIVSNQETEDPNQFIYLGEITRNKINNINKHEFKWNTKLPILSLGDGNSKAPPVGSVGIDRKELIGEIPLYLGGWYSDHSSSIMVSYADYLGPNDTEKTQLILMSKFTNGMGEIETIILDTKSDTAEIAPVAVDFELEEGGKLWPVYYMEEPDPSNPSGWKSFYVWFEDSYINIPENGKDGLVIDWLTVADGDYTAEVQVSNMFGDYSEPLKFDIRVEGDSKKVPELNLVLDGSYIEVNWSTEDQGDKVILQWTNNLKTNWNNITADQYEIQNGLFVYKERPRQEKRFYRLIKP